MSDQYWSYVKSLLHCNGVDNSIRIVDERHHQFSLHGAARISTLQGRFGGAALAFNGISDYMSSYSSVDFIAPVAGVDFTLEAWLYPRETENAAPSPISLSSFWDSEGSVVITVDHAAHPGKIALHYGDYSTTSGICVSASNIVYEQWVHVAATRSGNVFRLFINGDLESTTTFSGGTYGGSSYLYLGAPSAVPSRMYFGYIDEFRYTRGVARYSDSFTLQTAPFEHGEPIYDAEYDKVVFHSHFDDENGSNMFIDRKGHTLTTVGGVCHSTTASRFGGSCLNTVSGGYIYHPATNDLNLGDGDFTVEFWVKLDAVVNYGSPFLRIKQSGSSNRYLGYDFDSGYLAHYLPSTSGDSNLFTSGFNIGPDVWTFCSTTRVGNSVHSHRNGVLVWSGTIGDQISFTNAPYTLEIGRLANFNGCIDELRVTKGVGRYAATNYPLPTDPFPDFAVQKLTGTVRDSSGVPISRIVRSYRSSDGMHIDSGMSDPVTGGFALRAMDVSKHFVVVHDDVKNALIYDHITPVI